LAAQPFAKYVEEESPKFAGDARYSKGLVRYKDLKDHIKNMQKSKYERDMLARRCKDLAGIIHIYRYIYTYTYIFIYIYIYIYI
jgi:hypothetical protein